MSLSLMAGSSRVAEVAEVDVIVVVEGANDRQNGEWTSKR